MRRGGDVATASGVSRIHSGRLMLASGSAEGDSDPPVDCQLGAALSVRSPRGSDEFPVAIAAPPPLPHPDNTSSRSQVPKAEWGARVTLDRTPSELLSVNWFDRSRGDRRPLASGEEE